MELRASKKSTTNEILLKALTTNRRRGVTMKFGKVFFDRSDQVIDILSDKYLHNQRSSRLEEFFAQIEDSKVEFDAFILVDTFLSRCFWGNI